MRNHLPGPPARTAIPIGRQRIQEVPARHEELAAKQWTRVIFNQATSPSDQVRDLQERVADSASERHANRGADFFVKKKSRLLSCMPQPFMTISSELFYIYIKPTIVDMR